MRKTYYKETHCRCSSIKKYLWLSSLFSFLAPTVTESTVMADR